MEDVKMKKCKRLISMMVLLMLFISTLTACTSQEPPASAIPETENGDELEESEESPLKDDRYGGDLVIATSYISNTLDPHYSAGATANYQWMQYVYENAICLGADGKYYPQICDFEYAEDGLSLKLTVRDYYFSDGTKVTIDDVVASFERAGKVGGSFYTKVMSLVTDTKIEGNSVTYTFSSVGVTTLTEIADVRGPGYIMPKRIIDKLGEGNQITDMADVIGTGCYVLTKYDPDVEIVLSRNENYVVTDFGGTGIAAPHNAYMDTITFSVNTDSNSRTAGMIAGDYSIGGITSDMAPYAEKIGLRKHLLSNQWTHAIFFNLSEENKDSIVQNKNFRKAVRAALDMDAIMLSIFEGDSTRYELEPSAIPASNKTYYNEILKNADYNIKDKELAKKYLEESGYNGEEITWLVSEGSAFYRAAVAAIQMLEDIGIKVNLWVVDSGSHGSLRADPAAGHDIGAWETQKAMINPAEQSSLVTGTAAGWWTNDTKTELLKKMQGTITGSEESVAAYKAFCELVAEEVPYIVFGTGKTLTYTQPNVELNYEGIISYYWNTYFTE
jgi:peptide/nickel transport system substrate-binding protein